MKIAMIASEVNPFAKTGGLADVVYALSKELRKLEQEIFIVLPLYGSINRSLDDLTFEQIASFPVHLGWRKQIARVFKVQSEGMTYFFIENEYYFGRESLYSYADDAERFAFFTSASAELFPHLAIKPDIIHLHDWQAGMLPLKIKNDERYQNFYDQTKIVLTIHNPAFHGRFENEMLGDFYNLPSEINAEGQYSIKGQISSLKAAILTVDKITTVSPTHAEELLTEEGGKDLQNAILTRKDDFYGILNGIDYDEFNPRQDALIKAQFDEKTLNENKQINKEALLNYFQLPNLKAPTFGIVSRLSWQKGIDLIIAGAKTLLAKGGNLIILGRGEYGAEVSLQHLAKEFPKQVGLFLGYSNELAHAIYAGSDFFLMPSLFEPCGSGQMIAHRYGTLPIVRYTGGLVDTVTGYNGHNLGNANGFGFAEYDSQAMSKEVEFALQVYEQPKVIEQLRLNALAINNNWSKSAEQYLNLYRQIL